MAKRTIDKAKAAKEDEFYTQLEDINNELRHYREHFRGKTVLCNCDDPRVSNFFTYFAYNFEFLGLKKLITTCYKNQDIDLFTTNNSEEAVYLIYEGDKNGDRIPTADEIGVHPLKGDGDFRSPECLELLKEADIVVTNPPFSLFREYVESGTAPMAFEVCWQKPGEELDYCVEEIRKMGSRIWVNTLWPSLCGGFGNDDDAALTDPAVVYGRHIQAGASMIQTDRPELLLNYLRSIGRHD